MSRLGHSPLAALSTTGHGSGPQKSATFGTSNFQPAAPSVTQPLGSQLATKTRLANLSTKLNDLDVDLAKSSRTKQTYKGKIDGMEFDVHQVALSQNKLQVALADAEDRLQRCAISNPTPCACR